MLLSREAARYSSDVSQVIGAAVAAQCVAKTWTMELVNDVVAGLGCHMYREDVADRLSEAAVQESGIGNVQESYTRLRGRILGALQEMASARTIGQVGYDEAKGLSRYAKPVGVIAALTPATAPVATVVVHALNAIKTRNAIIFCPNPGVFETVAETVRTLRVTLEVLGAPADLVQMVSSSAREYVDDIIQRSDLVIATGSNRTVARALGLGTPGYGGGVGNAIIMVDDTADIELAASQIVASKAFDNGTSCSSESCVLVERSRAAALTEALGRHGGWVLDAGQSAQLLHWVWPDEHLRRDVVGRTAIEIAAAADLIPPPGTRILVLSAEPTEMHLVSREKLSPILGLVPVDTNEEMLSLACTMLAHAGAGHSCGIFSKNPARIDEFADHLPVSRIMVNQSTGFGNTGCPTNGMPHTVVLSCGPWGGTNTNDNITWRHFLNYTVVSKSIAPLTPDERELFGRHWPLEASLSRAVASTASE
jgi:sulfoacetaldehyde dehydrogenase